MIRRGYRLPFAQYPSQCFLKNDRSALQHPKFVAEAITELLSNGCIVEHVVPPFCMNPLTVAEGKKLRLLIDLRRVNNCLVKPRFKYEDLRSLSQVLDEEHWFFTWDLKSGYIMLIFVLITKSISVLLGLFPALLDILPLQFFLSALVVPAFSAFLDGTVVSGMWEPEDIGQSSKFRKLKATYFLLLSYVAQLKHKRVKIFTDNQGAARIVAIGSSKINLQALAMDIFNLCLVNSIILEAQWIPRSLNERADFLSRFVDKDDWSVNPSVFRVIDAKWGPHTIDRFASHYNAQVPRFNSKFSSPGCSGVDALA